MAKKAPLDDIAADLAARLKNIRTSLQSTQGVHDSLAELYILLAQDRVSPRRAAVLAYLSSLLLRSLDDTEEDAATQKPEVKIIFGRGPKPGIEEVTDESQLTEDRAACYTVRTTYGPRPRKGATSAESEAIANYEAIST